MLYFFLPGILFLGVASSLSDIRQGKIRNRDVIIGIGYAIIVYALLISYGLDLSGFNHLLFLGTNLLFGGVVSLLLWYFAYWSAGDAKLFIAYIILIPPSVYPGYHNVGSVYLFVNVFVPLFLFYFVKGLFNIIIEKRVMGIVPGYKEMGLYFVGVLGISWLPGLFGEIMGIKVDVLLAFLGIYALFALLRFLLKNSMLWVLVGLFVMRLVLKFNEMVSVKFIYESLVFVLLFLLIRMASRAMLGSKKMKISRMEEGMMLAEMVYLKDGKKGNYQKSLLVPSTFLKRRYFVIGYENNYLEREDLKILNRLNKDKRFPFKELRVRETLYFAPFMFLGVLITIFISRLMGVVF